LEVLPWQTFAGVPPRGLECGLRYACELSPKRTEVPRGTGREVIEVVKGSDTRRFRVQVENKFWGPLSWTPKRMRAIQSHCEILLQKCSIQSLVKEVYSLDPDIDIGNLEDKRGPYKWPKIDVYN